MDKHLLKNRSIASEIINKSFKQNKRLSDVTSELLNKEKDRLSNHDKRFITMLVQGTVRLSGRLEWELNNVFKGDLQDLKMNLRTLLQLGAYQLLYMDSVPDYAAVTTTVQLAKKIHPNLAGITNALLRALVNKDNYKHPNNKSPICELAAYLSHPEWLIKKWIKDRNYKYACDLVKWNNSTPSYWFRTNSIQFPVKNFISYLNEEKIEFCQFEHIQNYFKLNKNQKILQSKLFKKGNISLQDPAAGLVVKLLDPNSNESIIDACAAPGGKTSYIAEIMNNKGKITALDINEKRLKILQNTINRLNITNVTIKLHDITASKISKTSKMLLDVPCTGTGVLAKRADTRWRRNIDDILEMHLLQRKILWKASSHIKPGGILIYSTCSIEREENWMVIEAFLKTHPNFSIENANNYIPKIFVDNKGALYTCPIKHKIDGGFAVRLKNNAS